MQLAPPPQLKGLSDMDYRQASKSEDDFVKFSCVLAGSCPRREASCRFGFQCGTRRRVNRWLGNLSRNKPINKLPR